MAIAHSNTNASAVKQMGLIRTSYTTVLTSARTSLEIAQAANIIIAEAGKQIKKNAKDIADQCGKTMLNVGFAHVRMNVEMREALDVPQDIKTIKEYEMYLLNKKNEENKEGEGKKGGKKEGKK